MGADQRSMISITEAVTTAGSAKMMMKALTSSAHTKSGMRSSVMPGRGT
jgi:hypothetical protein